MPNVPKSETPRPNQQPREKQSGRLEDHTWIYNSTRWRKLRAWHIANHPLCVECQKENVIKAGKVVDHITPIREGGGAFDTNNLQTLCTRHHNQKSGRESAAAKKRRRNG